MGYYCKGFIWRPRSDYEQKLTAVIGLILYPIKNWINDRGHDNAYNNNRN